MRRINEMDIRFLTRVRTGIEIDMAKALYALFNDQPIIGTMRDGIDTVLQMILDEIDYESKAFKDESGLLLVFKSFGKGNKGKDALVGIMQSKASWSASDCSDLIRLIATLVEKGGQGFTETGKGGKAVTEGQGLMRRFKPGSSFSNVVGNPATAAWSGRSRIKDKEILTTRGYTAGPRHIVEGRNQIDVERMVLNANVSREKAFYGIKDVRLMPHSTVRKIDTAFGLPQGADISGTTADSIIILKQVNLFSRVLEQAARKQLPEAVLQLLPLATMVSLGHHTVVESALTLTLSRFINYSIGFYSTLMPNPTDRRGIDEEVSGRMMRALCNAESHRGNIHFICYYTGSAYEGLVYETRAELEEFRKFAWVADPFREEMGSLSPHVPQDQLLDAVDWLGKRRITYANN